MKKVQKLEVIEYSGSPYEVSRQYGEAAKANIMQSIDTLVTRMNASVRTNQTELLANTRAQR